MLILTRKPGESLFIGDEVKITIIEIKGNQIRIGISAPKDLRIYREEIYLQIIEENKEAAGLIDSEEFSHLGTQSGTYSSGSSDSGAQKLVIKPVSGMNLAKGKIATSSLDKGKGMPPKATGVAQHGSSESFAKLSQQVSPTVVIKKKRNPSESES